MDTGSGTWGASVLTWMQGSGHMLELVRSQGEGAPCLGVLAECVCSGLAHGEGWGLGPAPTARGGSWWAELARSGRRFRERGRLGGGRRGARSCTTAGRPRSAEGSWCGPADLHFACWPGCEWQVAGGARRRSENGRARPAQVLLLRLREKLAPRKSGSPCGRWAPCQHPALQGPWRGWGAGAGPEAERGRKSEIGVAEAGRASRGPALQASRHLLGLCSWGCLGGCQPPPARPWRALLLSDGISSGLCIFQV